MKKIFLVEDCEYLHPRYIFPLKVNGYTTLAFTNKEDMFSQLEQEQPQLLLLDYTFVGKGYTGYDIAQEVLNNFPDLTLIVVSGNLNDELEEKFKDIGVHHFIKKPFTNEDLLHTVTNAMKERKEIYG